MPILRPTEISGRVAYLGVVLDRATTLCSEARERLSLTFDGAEGECHSGRTRSSCSRVKLQFAKGTVIANARQLSVLSVEELAAYFVTVLSRDREALERDGVSALEIRV